MKRGLASLTVVWMWLVGLNYVFDNKIPVDIKEAGLFKKYSIAFKE